VERAQADAAAAQAAAKAQQESHAADLSSVMKLTKSVVQVRLLARDSLTNSLTNERTSAFAVFKLTRHSLPARFHLSLLYSTYL